ncbi:helix-turn-helix domain-containing protein [Streptococcus pneumoniae]|uniref:helix-turn-helix domain-containing protein n=1 Tax=Streptococcus pneumoniae TaxID=1313 RepID=UPI002150952D|nr:helix-turn-helix domain-containing protein [Streptococcus pneumoniae]
MDFTAVGIMMVVLANHPNWQVYPDEIAKRKGVNRKTIESISKSLKRLDICEKSEKNLLEMEGVIYSDSFQM